MRERSRRQSINNPNSPDSPDSPDLGEFKDDDDPLKVTRITFYYNSPDITRSRD